MLAEALAHASTQDAAFRQLTVEGPRNAWRKAALALVILLLALYLGASPPSWLVPGPPATLTRSDVERGTDAALYLEAQQIEAFHLERGRFPYGLDELPNRIPGVVFVRSNNRVYQLVARRADGSSLIYDSAHPDPGFAAAAAGWSAKAGSR